MNRKFTLIELIVVIAILGILSAIIIPNISNIQGKAETTAMIANMKNLQTASDMYALDNNNILPTVGEVTALVPQPIDFSKIKPDYLRNLPKTKSAKYWVDVTGTIWASKTDSPLNVENSNGKVTWDQVEGAEGYQVFEVKGYNSTSSLKVGTISYVFVGEKIGKEGPFEYSTETGKTYAISSIDKDGNLSAPVGSKDYVSYESSSSPESGSQKPEELTVFEKVYGGSSREHITSTIATSDGYVSVGDTNSTDGDFSTTKHNDDIYIMKTDKNGNKEWVKTYGGNGTEYINSLIETTDGYIGVGTTTSNNSGDIPATTGTNNMLIIKFDFDGNLKWVKTYAQNDYSLLSSVSATTNGFIAVGSTNVVGSGDASDMLLLKFDTNGNKVWVKTYGGNEYDNLIKVKATSDGFVAVGTTSSNNNGDIPATLGEYDIVIAKFDLNGDKVWLKTYGDTGQDEGRDIIVESNGYVVSGITTTSGQFMDGSLAKFDLSGNMVWEKRYGGSVADSFDSLAKINGGYVVAGYTSSNNSGDIPDTGTPANSLSGLIAKFDTNGNKIWLQTYYKGANTRFTNIVPSSNGFLATGTIGITRLNTSGDIIMKKFDLDGNK